MTTLEKFGAKLRIAREQKGLTQNDLVERLGYKDSGAISEYEHGKRRLYAYELDDYAQALEVPVSYFFQDDLKAQSDMETVLLQWFRNLPPERKPRIFKMLQAIENLTPLVIGEMPSEATLHLNEERGAYRARGKRK